MTKTKLEHHFKSGFRISGIEAQAVGDCLEEIRGGKKGVEPAMVVAAAKKKKHPFHPLFEWDDEVAGQIYRLRQARDILAAIYSYRVDGDGNRVRVRSWSHVILVTEEDPVSCYMPTEEVLAMPELRAQLLLEAKRDADIFKAKYGHLKEVATIIAAIDEVL